MKINTKALEAEWVKYNDDVELNIRPARISTNSMRIDGNTAIGPFMLEMFDYCVIDWKGFVDENDKDLKCNRKNKELVLNIVDGIGNFVFEYQEKLKKRFEDEIKN